MPLRGRRGFVVFRTQMNRVRDLRQRHRELQIRGSRVSRIAAQDHQRRNLARRHLAGQVFSASTPELVLVDRPAWCRSRTSLPSF